MKIDSGYLILTEEERKILKAKFNLLTTIAEKFSFWEEKFNFDYSFHYNLQEHTIVDFLIKPKNHQETEVLNKTMYNAYLSTIESNKKSIVLDWKNDFIKNIETAPDKQLVKDVEINKINEYIPKKRQSSHINSWPKATVSVFDSNFLEGYEGYLLRMEEFNWRKRLYDYPSDIHYILQGIEYAKYMLFVRNYKGVSKKDVDIILNGEQKFLVYYYLGLGNELKTNTDRSKVFGYFIDELKSTTIRPMFSNPEQFETVENLDTVITLFKQLKLDQLAKELEAKLPNINKRR